MAQNFPNNPVVGTTATINGEVWVYDGYGWIRTVSSNVDGGTPTTNYGGTSTVYGGSP